MGNAVGSNVGFNVPAEYVAENPLRTEDLSLVKAMNKRADELTGEGTADPEWDKSKRPDESVPSYTFTQS